MNRSDESEKQGSHNKGQFIQHLIGAYCLRTYPSKIRSESHHKPGRKRTPNRTILETNVSDRCASGPILNRKFQASTINDMARIILRCLIY